MIYIVINGNFVYLTTNQIITIYKRFQSAEKLKYDIERVSKDFYSHNDNTNAAISKRTKLIPYRVHRVLTKYLFTKKEIIP